MGAASREIAERRFDEGIVLRAYLEAVESAIGGRRYKA